MQKTRLLISRQKRENTAAVGVACKEENAAYNQIQNGCQATNTGSVVTTNHKRASLQGSRDQASRLRHQWDAPKILNAASRRWQCFLSEVAVLSGKGSHLIWAVVKQSFGPAELDRQRRGGRKQKYLFLRLALKLWRGNYQTIGRDVPKCSASC